MDDECKMISKDFWILVVEEIIRIIEGVVWWVLKNEGRDRYLFFILGKK